ncbi:hypothetical protein [Kitasatospora sp. NPDC050543]|uniref:hypothetical protein n=1 Tax=Kitasatospora sp. NPDC050543 TaxID=3364054 RepID=UPI0037B16A46
MSRFRDDNRTKYDFLDDVLVTCPRCGRPAHIRPVPDADPAAARPHFEPRRLACTACSFTVAADGRWVGFSRAPVHRARDPYLGLPLLLQLPTRHGVLWAHNHEQLSVLERYVRAGLREQPVHSAKSMVVDLPRWLKLAANREENLRAIARIRKRALGL